MPSGLFPARRWGASKADVAGIPLWVILVVVGIIVLIAAWLLHWLLIIVGVVLIAVGIYVLFFGGLP